MADIEQKSTIDFRRGGDTVHDLTEKYMQEIPYLYDAINSIRGNKSTPSTENVPPAANQWYVDSDGKVYMRSKDNTKFNFVGENAPYFGMKDPEDDGDFLTTSDVGNGPGKIPQINNEGALPLNITGNAAKIGGYTVDLAGLRDGQLLAYSAAENKIVPVNRVQTGDGNITFSRTMPDDGSFWIKPID